jgi:hypothetical protein
LTMADPADEGGFWYKGLRCAEWKDKMDFSNSGLDIKNPYDLLIGKCKFTLPSLRKLNDVLTHWG